MTMFWIQSCFAEGFFFPCFCPFLTFKQHKNIKNTDLQNVTDYVIYYVTM